ncbi:MAG: hypothetical protein WC408_05950, partial [Candidatus Micrarchaeia archaeon]
MDWSKVFGAGSEAPIYIRYGLNNGCKNSNTGSPFEVTEVTFIYDKTGGVTGFSQVGVKPLNGKCANTDGLFFNPSSSADGASATTASGGANITLNATIDSTTASQLSEFGLVWNGTSTPFYDSSLVLAMNFDDVYSTSAPSTPSCATNWTLVPGNASLGTNDFCVMTYEARNIGGFPVSTANGTTPWVSINQTYAADRCGALGPGYHLISDPEWMTIAHNVVQQPANWNSSVVGVGSLKMGNVGGTNTSVSYNGADPDT